MESQKKIGGGSGVGGVPEIRAMPLLLYLG